MRITVEGQLRRRTRVNLGPFRREWWKNETFSWKHMASTSDNGKFDTVAEDVDLGVEYVDGVVFVRGRIRNRGFILSESRYGEGRTVPFSVLSVAGLEISGKIIFDGPLATEPVQDRASR